MKSQQMTLIGTLLGTIEITISNSFYWTQTSLIETLFNESNLYRKNLIGAICTQIAKIGPIWTQNKSLMNLTDSFGHK